jgi:1-deoxy-D-xylulose-5-phosphate reductoisomerase
MQFLVIFGATGSIGTSSLDILRKYPDKFRLVGISARKRVEALREIAEEFKVPYVIVEDEKDAQRLRSALSYKAEVDWGEQGLKRLAELPEVHTLVVGISGIKGLIPAYYGLLAGKKVALANKESLVVAGPLLRKAVKNGGGRIIPVDSEHSALFQLIYGREDEVEEVILTASGGPFYFCSKEELSEVTPEMAVKHPNWKMGAKISVDSATLMNKGFEVIEAMELFGFPVEKVKVLVHPQSIVHGMVRLKDGSVLAHLSIPDMRLAILYALSYPERWASGLPSLDLVQVGRLEFLSPDVEKFPCLALAYKVAKQGGLKPLVLEAADEVVVELFLKGHIKFLHIPYFLERVLEEFRLEGKVEDLSVNQILEYHRKIREFTKELVKREMKKG